MSTAPEGLTSVEQGAALSHPRPEILALTGLRGLAAVGVVLHHIGVPRTAPAPLKHLVEAGSLGVPLFILLSGFVLAYNYPTLGLGSGQRELGRYVMARVARILPLTALVGVAALLYGEARGTGWLRAVFGEQLWFIGLIVVLYAVFPVLVPVVARIAERSGARGLLMVAGIAFGAELVVLALRLATGSNAWLYRNPLSWIPELVIGMALAFLIAGGWQVERRTAYVVQAACVLYAVLVAVQGFGSAVTYGAVWGIPLGLVILTLAGAPTAKTAGWLASSPAVHLGAIGLALFLTHRLILRGLGHLPSTDLTSALLACCWVGIALLLAEGAHRYVGVPGRRGLLALARRLDRRTGPTPEESEPESEPENAVSS